MNPIILFEDTGELGNRLVTSAYLTAFALEHKTRAHLWTLWRYAHYFNGKSQSPLCMDLTEVSPIFRNYIQIRPFHNLLRKFLFDDHLIAAPVSLAIRILSAAASRLFPKIDPILKILGFQRREQVFQEHHCACLVENSLAEKPIFDPALVVKHASTLRRRFAFTHRLREEAEDYVNQLRDDGGTVVGVHIRRGDYFVYKQGQWFLSDHEYFEAMRHFAQLLERQGHSIRFVICSNAPIREENFSPLSVVQGPGSMIRDMTVLAACDLILGAPSTFSGWASFAGDVPLFFVERAKKLPNEFKFPSWIPRYF